MSLFENESSQIEIASSVFDDMVFECMTEVFFAIHRESKISRQSCQICQQHCRHYSWTSGLDIFGQNLSQMIANDRYPCTECDQRLIPSRYAPHLEKCMNMGRQAARKKNQAAIDDDEGSDGRVIGSDVTAGEESDRDSVTKDTNWTAPTNAPVGRPKKIGTGAKRGRKKGSLNKASLGRISATSSPSKLDDTTLNGISPPKKVKKLKLKKPSSLPIASLPE